MVIFERIDITRKVVMFERINVTREIWERKREVKRIIKSKPSEITRIKVVM